MSAQSEVRVSDEAKRADEANLARWAGMCDRRMQMENRSGHPIAADDWHSLAMYLLGRLAALRSAVGAPRGQTEEGALADAILAELQRARTKFPGDNVTMLALMEEVGELAKATFEESRERVRKEAIQVATMAMRVVLDGDATLDTWRHRKGLDPLFAPASPQ